MTERYGLQAILVGFRPSSLVASSPSALVLQAGRAAVSCSWDNTLKVWDLEAGDELRMPAGHSGRVRGAALSANRDRPLALLMTKTLKVWNPETCACVAIFTSDARALCYELCRHAPRIITGDRAGPVHFLTGPGDGK